MNEYLREAFSELGKTQKEIIEDLGKSQPYVSALMNGKKDVGKDVAYKLTELYGFDYASILRGVSDSALTINQKNKKGNNIIRGSDSENTDSGLASLIDLFRAQLSEKDNQINKKDEQIDKLLNLLNKQ